MNVIDAILVEDAIRDAQLDGSLVKIRAKLNKAYDRIEEDRITYDEPPEYIELGEEGIPGFVVS